MKGILIALMICLAAVGAACVRSMGSSFFSNFSMRKLVDNNKTNMGLACDPNGGGGGGGGTVGTGGFGFGARRFHASKSDSFACTLKSGAVERFDEPRLIAALQLDVEKALSDSGAKITDRGHPGTASFYFAYTLQNIDGRGRFREGEAEVATTAWTRISLKQANRTKRP